MKEDESPRESLRALNTREKKEVNKRIAEHWDCELDKSLVWLLSNKDKLYVATPDISVLDFKKLRIDKVGLYVCTVTDKDVRPSIEGSQILGPQAKKNVLDITPHDVDLWLRGNDLDIDPKGCQGCVMLRCGTDFVGCGKVTQKGILNFVPKARRIISHSKTE